MTLRLSSFIVSQAAGKKKETVGGETGAKMCLLHEVSGTYPLSKAKASDRVSGSLSLHAYLHMPDSTYVESIRASAMPWSVPLALSPPVIPQRRQTTTAKTAWAAGEASVTDSPAHQETKSFNPLIDHQQESKDPDTSPLAKDEWEEDDDDILELTFAPHSPKIAESPDRRLFKHKPPVFSFGENGPHGPDTKSKIRVRPSTADDAGGGGGESSMSMQCVQSDLVGGSKQLGLDFNDDSDSEAEGCGEDRDEWDPSGLEQFSTHRAPKGVPSRSASSPNTLSYNRQSMLDGVSKCLNGLSVAQDGADCFLEKMQKQLDGRQSAKSVSRAGKTSPRRSRSDTSISTTKVSMGEGSYPEPSTQRALMSTPTRNKKEKDREKGNERGRDDENSKDKGKEREEEKDKDKDQEKEKEKDKDKEKGKERIKGDENSKEKAKDREKYKEKEKEKEKEKDNGKEVGKYQVYKAVKVAAVSNFMSLSPAPVTISPPPPAPSSRFNADSPFRDVTDYYDDRKASRDDELNEKKDVGHDGGGEGEGEGDDEDSGSVDSSEMIVIASTGFTITTSSTGVGRMTSNPSTPPSASASASTSVSHTTPSKHFSHIPLSPAPSISLFASDRSPSESLLMKADQKEEVVMSEAWRRRNLEREKRSASVSPMRGGAGGGSSK